jgi:hypothetical protein
MTKQVQRRRGTATQHTSFTGAEGETSVNTTNKSIHVHDGTTTGGFEAARIDLTNVTGATVAGKVTGSTLSSLTITSADINGGTVDNVAIGNTTPSSGLFTTLNASSTLTLGGTAVTSTAAELNILDGVTATAAELNVLDGVTATAAELNLVDGSAAGSVVINKAVIYSATGQVNATSLDISGDIDVDGTTNLDVVDIDGAVDMASTLLVTGVLTTTAATVSNGGGQFNGAINVGVDDTGYDVKFFGATAGAYMLWDESADDLILGGAAGLSVNSAATVGGTLGVTGVVTANAGVVVDNFTLDGTTLALSSGDFTLDIAGDIILDADDGEIFFKDGGASTGKIRMDDGDLQIRSLISDKNITLEGNDGGSIFTALTLDMSAGGYAIFNNGMTLKNEIYINNADGSLTVGYLYNDSNDFIVRSYSQDKDIIFKGNDAGGIITALTLDMSEAGTATFNKDILLGDDSAIRLGASQDLALFHDATNSTIRNNTGDLILDVAADIILNADGGDWKFQDGATGILEIQNDGSGNAVLITTTSDKDMRFLGNDGGSTITALTLDMSAAGAATFNSTITAAGGAGDYNNTANVLTLNGTQHTRLLIDTSSTVGHQAALVLESNGQLTSFANSGSNSTIANDIGVFAIDSADDIILDAGGSDILLKVAGTTFGSLRENSSNFRIKSDVSDKDMLFLGNDGGVEFTALTLDMSDGGNAIFSGQITSSRGAATSTYGFRHNGAGRYMRMGCPNESYAYFETDTDSGFNFDGSVFVNGALSKSSGSFKIDHPLPAKTETHNLVHSFIEGPQADNIYRGKVALVDGSATVNIDDVAGMTDGTFAVLNREVQCFTSNETGWTAVRGSVSGNILTIEAQDASCTDTISWMVIGERQDKHMYDTEWTDENGKVIVEPLKEK